jgi:hypothetical protein
VKYYFHPKSLTWWMGLAPIASGVFIASAPLHHLASAAQVISTMWGDASPSALIASGLTAIGLRSAIANQGTQP